MAKIAAVSGLLSEALCVNASLVETHVKGLRGAGRLQDTDVSAWESADLLCALLSPDPGNATGPYHLPYVGAMLMQDGAFVPVPEGSYLSNLFGVEFGEAVCSLIQAAADKPDPPYIGDLQVTGRGETLRATITYQCVDGVLWSFFGYRMLPELLTQKPDRPLSLQGRLSVDLGITAALGQLLVGAPVFDFIPHAAVATPEARH